MNPYSSLDPNFLESSGILDYASPLPQGDYQSLFPSLFPEEKAQTAVQEKTERAAKRTREKSAPETKSDFKIPAPKAIGGRDHVAKRREEKTERAAKRARLEPGSEYNPATVQVAGLSFLRFKDLSYHGFNIHPGETYQVRFNIAKIPDKGERFSFLYKGKIHGKSIDFTKAGYTILAREGCCIPLDDGTHQFLLIFSLNSAQPATPVPDHFLMDIGIHIFGQDVWILKGLNVVGTAGAKPPSEEELTLAIIEEKRASARLFETLMKDGSIKSSDDLLAALHESHQRESQALSSLMK